MIKGTPAIGDELFFSYNKNVSGHYAGQGYITFHDEDRNVDETTHEALISKCDIEDATVMNTDQMFWATKDYYDLNDV